MTAAQLRPWILAARPKTLGAAIAPVMVGSVLGWFYSGAFHAGLMLAALASCMCLQIATNFFNDAVDGLKGSDTHERLGPVRITASGLMTPRAVLIAAAAMLLAAIAFALPLLAVRGWTIIAIGLPSLYFCYGYTGGPVPLAYTGLGELFVILFFGLVAVTGSAFLQSGKWHAEAAIAGLFIGMLSTVLIAINNLRDVVEDRRSCKRTLAVRFGIRFAKLEILLLAGGVLIGGSVWWWASGEQLVAAVHGVASVPMLLVAWAVANREPSRLYNRFLALAGASLILYSFGLCGSLVVARSQRHLASPGMGHP